MGIFNDHIKHNYKNNIIEIEARTTANFIEYDLIINNNKCDNIKGLLGNMKLRGYISINNKTTPLTIIIKQSLFGTKYFLETENNNIKLN